MNILLTTSAAPFFSPFSTDEKRFPLGIGFLISVIKNAGHKVSFIDNYLEPSHFYETDYVIKNKIDVVGIYANTICYDNTLTMFYALENLRKNGKWKGKIIVGGPHTSVSPDTIPDFVDYIIQGEGEKAILDILDGKTERVVSSERINDPDSLPMPAWDEFVKLPYDYSMDWIKETPVFTMNTSRGCPFPCTFCSVGSIWGKKYTFMSAQRIYEDISYLKKKYNVKAVYFREDNFTLNKKRVLEFCELILKNNLDIKWICETRVDTLNKELIELMHRAGCRAFYLGVESGSQRVLEFFKKGITVEQARNVVRWCKKTGINAGVSFVVGAPGETEQERQETFNFARELKRLGAISIWLNVFVGIPNSELYFYALNNKYAEHIDRKGMIFLSGHDEMVDKVYGKRNEARVPFYKDIKVEEAAHDFKDIEVIKENQNNMPRVSVVMSVYNGEKYLKSAVESILNQTYTDFEFIIIDDGSTDSSLEILKNYNDSRVRLINQGNKGLTRSLNVGLKLAKGEFIARADADDISHPERLEKQVFFFEKYPEYGILGTTFEIIDEDDSAIQEMFVLVEDNELREALIGYNQFCHGSVMFPRKVITEIGYYNPDVIFSQDYEFWVRISGKYKIANLPESLYKWRRSKKCISVDKYSYQSTFVKIISNRAFFNKRRYDYWTSLPFSLQFKNQEKDRELVLFPDVSYRKKRMMMYGRACFLIGIQYFRTNEFEKTKELCRRGISYNSLSLRNYLLLFFAHLKQRGIKIPVPDKLRKFLLPF